jgi:pimeloyl-ACP methyl ester carboxylesterase
VLGVRAIPLDELKDKYENADSRYIEVDGTNVHYRIEGTPGKPTMILLHGVLASLHTWDGWMPFIKDHFQIVRIDVPGFGMTGPMAADDYTPEYAIKFFEMMRVKLSKVHPEIDANRFILVGNSLGGFLSWYYAAHYPEHVEKLILIDPIAYPQKLPFIIAFASRPFWGMVASFQSPRFIIKRNVRKVYGDASRVTNETIDRYHDLLLRRGNRSSMVKYFKVLRFYSTNTEICKDIPKIKAPTFLMHGEVDRWVPPELVERWKQDLPGIKVKVYPTAGHIPMEELPRQTAQDAVEWLIGEIPRPVREPAPREEAPPVFEDTDPEQGDSVSAPPPSEPTARQHQVKTQPRAPEPEGADEQDMPAW